MGGTTREEVQEEAKELRDAAAADDKPGAPDTFLKEEAPPKKPARFPHDYAFLILAPENPIRVNAAWLTNHPKFDNFILVCIIISSLCMGVDMPLANPADPGPTALRALGMLFSIIFIFETALKHVALGLFFGKNCYWRNAWNILDGVVVMVSVVDLAASGSGLAWLKTLRILRALRPLRVISRNESLKLVVNTLFKAFPEMLNLLIVGFLFFLIFALFGVSYFKGGFNACSDPYDRNVVYLGKEQQ